MNKEQIDEIALRVASEVNLFGRIAPDNAIKAFTHALLAELAKVSEPIKGRFDCWSTNEGDSWYEHPADAELLYEVLGDEPKVGDEFEVMAGWTSVQARYRISSKMNDDFEVECISHPEDNIPQPDLVAENERKEWALLMKADIEQLRQQLSAAQAELADTESDVDTLAQHNIELQADNEQLVKALDYLGNNLGEYAGAMPTQQQADVLTNYAEASFQAIATHKSRKEKS